MWPLRAHASESASDAVSSVADSSGHLAAGRRNDDDPMLGSVRRARDLPHGSAGYHRCVGRSNGRTASGSASSWRKAVKKKPTKKERSERARLEAENSPIVRQLRELYERGMAELAERRRLDPDAR